MGGRRAGKSAYQRAHIAAALAEGKIVAVVSARGNQILHNVPDFRTVAADRLREWIAVAPNALRSLLVGGDPAEWSKHTQRTLAVAMGAVYVENVGQGKPGLRWPVNFSVIGDVVEMIELRSGAPLHIAQVDLWELRLALVRHGVEL